MNITILQTVPPGHCLSGKELQLVVVQTETVESDQTSEGLSVQVVQRVVTETHPFDVLQALEGKEAGYLFNVPKNKTFKCCIRLVPCACTWKAMLGMYTS